MAQVTDYVIANGSGSAVRADINNVFDATKTCNAGTSAPSNPAPGMLWFDTGSSPNSLKRRNSANNAWEEVSPRGEVAEIAAFGKSTAPSGWLKCNGAAVSRNTYSALFAEIGTSWGNGDGSTTFNLPDLRGEFLRGWDDGAGVDSGRVFGSWQDHAFQDHTHRLRFEYDQSDGLGFKKPFPGGGAFASNTQDDWVQGAITGNVAGETRPRNLAVLFCIKY